MPESAVLRDLEETAAGWSVTGRYGKDLVMLAADALVEGIDTPELRDLAGQRATAANWELTDLVTQTLESLKLRTPDPATDLTRALALRFLCRRYLVNELSSRDLVSWVGDVWEYEPPDAGRGFLQLFYDDLMEQMGIEAWSRSEVSPLARGYLTLSDEEIVQRTARSVDLPLHERLEKRYSRLARVAVPIAAVSAIAAFVALIVILSTR